MKDTESWKVSEVSERSVEVSTGIELGSSECTAGKMSLSMLVIGAMEKISPSQSRNSEYGKVSGSQANESKYSARQGR